MFHRRVRLQIEHHGGDATGDRSSLLRPEVVDQIRINTVQAFVVETKRSEATGDVGVEFVVPEKKPENSAENDKKTKDESHHESGKDDSMDRREEAAERERAAHVDKVQD